MCNHCSLYRHTISIVGLNLGVISMLIEFILVAKHNFYIVKKLLWKFIYKEKVVKGESLKYKSLCSKILTVSPFLNGSNTLMLYSKIPFLSGSFHVNTLACVFNIKNTISQLKLLRCTI